MAAINDSIKSARFFPVHELFDIGDPYIEFGTFQFNTSGSESVVN